MEQRGFFDSLSIGHKIGMGFIMTGILFFSVVYIFYATLFGAVEDYDRLLRIHEAKKSHALNISRNLLEARRSEKDFLSRKDVTYVDRVAQKVDGVIAEAKALELIEAQLGTPGAAAEIQRLIQIYHSSFRKIVAAWKVKGLEHDQGLQGRFRETIHELEAKTEAFEALGMHVTVLQIRRREKDYLLRGDKLYVGMTRDGVAALVRQITQSKLPTEEKKAMSELLARYRAEFLALVAQNDRIIELTERMRDAAHRIEPLDEVNLQEAVASMARAAAAVRSESTRSASWALGLALLGLFLGGALAHWIIHRITGPVSTLVALSELLAGEAPEKEANDAGGYPQEDEIGQLAGMMGRITAGLAALSMHLNDHAETLESTSTHLIKTSHGLVEEAEALEQGCPEEAASSVIDKARHLKQLGEEAEKDAMELSRVSAGLKETLDRFQN